MTPEFLVPRRPAAKKVETLASPILQLKVRLLDLSPMVWRRVLVPASFTLRELHGVIQVAMGWESLHLYCFHIRAVQYGSFDLCVQSRLWCMDISLKNQWIILRLIRILLPNLAYFTPSEAIFGQMIIRSCSQTGRAGRCWPGCYFEVNRG